MKSTLIASSLLAGLVFASAPSFLHAGQRSRNPGGDSGGSAGGSSSGGSTGGTAVPRDGGSTSWGGGGVSSRPSEPTSSTSSAGRRTTRAPSGGSSGGGYQGVPAYSRPRNGAPVTGYGVARGSIATLPPIVSGPIYWGPDNWYFYPWGFGGLGLGYFWDPWMWSGFYGGMAGYGGYPYMSPYYGGGAGSFGSWDGGGGGSPDETGQLQVSQGSDNPLDENRPTGGLRLKVEPRDAEVFVDGFYAGRVDDFDGAMQKLKIVHGPHRIELRAEGYETATFNVNVVIGETTSYKTELKRR